MTGTQRKKKYPPFLFLFIIISFLVLSNDIRGFSDGSKKTSDSTTKIIVARNENRLYFYDLGKLMKSYPVSVGNAIMGKATPGGRFIIINKVKNPIHSSKITLASRNSFGARWMGLAKYETKKYRGYGIQGTNVEASIGKQLTVGSIQMHNKDIIELFNYVDLGTEVVIR